MKFNPRIVEKDTNGVKFQFHLKKYFIVFHKFHTCKLYLEIMVYNLWMECIFDTTASYQIKFDAHNIIFVLARNDTYEKQSHNLLFNISWMNPHLTKFWNEFKWITSTSNLLSCSTTRFLLFQRNSTSTYFTTIVPTVPFLNFHNGKIAQIWKYNANNWSIILVGWANSMHKWVNQKGWLTIWSR